MQTPRSLLPQIQPEVLTLVDAIDELDNAAQRMITALPFQMTEAAANLDAKRLAARKAMLEYAIGRASS